MNIEDAYRLLELKPGATLKEVVEARDDLLALWSPERLTHYPRLRSRAAAKRQEIQDAYSTLMGHLGEAGSRRDLADSPSAGRTAGASGQPSASLFDEVFSQGPQGRRWKVPLWAIVVVATALATGVYFLGIAANGPAAPAPEAPSETAPGDDEATAAQDEAEDLSSGAETPAEEQSQASIGQPETRPTVVPPPAAAKAQTGGGKTAEPQTPSGRRPVLVRRDAEAPSQTAPEDPRPTENQNAESQRQAYQSLLANSGAASRLVSGGFEDFRFLEWKVVKQEGAEVWIDLLAEKRGGEAVHFIWSVNAATSAVRPLSHAARDLERTGALS